MKKTAASLGVLLITLTALMGCGQKGPLSLPKPAGAASAASAPPH
ncbi:LPS translocon maturation chaperone LptM [Roseateles saccharophilus]|nr:lipoprotein [Roseateles saccharophilus]